MKNINNKQLHSWLWLILIILVIIAVMSFFVDSFGTRDGLVHVYFLNVVQGDAIFITTPNNQQILIDGGPDRSVLAELGKIMSFWDRSIDMIVLTHPDADHLNGLVDVLDRYKIDHIIETGIACDTSLCKSWKKSKKNEGAKLTLGHSGKIFDVDDVIFKVLYPVEDLEDQKVSKTNNSSLVLRMEYGEQSMLLTGDIESTVEVRLPYYTDELDVEFLKVAHHGSKNSSMEAFLDAVSPNFAFIQVGIDNKYNHPHPDVISRLDKNSIPYYRTDIDGRIELILDGTNYKIETKN